jgi:serine-type D-Ala-D-Ala carboxypeptidase (penicillin-binding protein 5/6)
VTRRLRTLLIAPAVVLLAPAGVGAQQRPPSVAAPAAVLVEPSTGDVVFERRADRARAMASTTKLMTALVTIEGASLDDTITVADYAAGPAESLAGLRAGDRMTVADLLRALILPSGNDAAVSLARGVAGSEAAFVRRMNRRARELGLRRTRFQDPIGLSPQNRSTPEELVKLALVLRRSSFMREVMDSTRARLRSADPDRTVVNRIPIVRLSEVTGIKSGRTAAAGYVLVGSGQRDGVTVLSAVMGDPSEAQRDADTLALLRYGMRRYRRTTVLREGQRMAGAGLRFRDERVDLVASRAVQRTVRRGERVTTRLLGVPAQLDGPLPRGHRVGTIEVRWRGRAVERVALVLADPVAEASLGQRVTEFAGRSSTVLLLAALGSASLLLLLMRRRVAARPETRPRDEPA